MTEKAIKRLQRDILEVLNCRETDNCPIKIEPKCDNNLFDLVGEISGPIGTPYEGGTFILDLQIPPNYPIKPPKVLFLTNIFHPNIVDKEICLDILDDEWSSMLTLRTLLISLQSLLAEPNHHDQISNDAQREEFNRKAREWTNLYAKSKDQQNAVKN